MWVVPAAWTVWKKHNDKKFTIFQFENTPWNITPAYFPGMALLKLNPRVAGERHVPLQPETEVMALKQKYASTQI